MTTGPGDRERFWRAAALGFALLAVALALLAWSFAVDVRWLHHTRPRT